MEGIFDVPSNVWIRVKHGGMCPVIEVRGPLEEVVEWVNVVYSGIRSGNPPILNPDSTFANVNAPGLPLGY